MNYLPSAIPDTEASEGGEVLVYSEDDSIGDIIADLASRTPQNEFGLPEFIFRSDMITSKQLEPSDQDAALVNLFYFEGFPQFANQGTFWNQLQWEPHQDFLLFQKFLDQALEVGIRQLDLLAAECSKSLEEIAEKAKTFYWSARARAYDMFIVAAEAKRRQGLIRKMENKHYSKSEQMLEKLQERFEGEFDDWVEELNAKEAVEVMLELMKMQRLSVGLTGQNASSTNRDIPEGATSAEIMRRIANNGSGGQKAGDNMIAILKSLTENPEEGATLQAAILKVTSGNNRQVFGEEL